MNNKILELIKQILLESKRSKTLGEKAIYMDKPESWPSELKNIFIDYCNSRSLKWQDCEEENGKMPMMMQDTDSGQDEGE
jgi:hypothetical protein